MANPSQIKASQINTEMGVASGTLLRASNNSVKNVAAVTSSTLKFSTLRAGINFPGRFVETLPDGSSTNIPRYAVNNVATISAIAATVSGTVVANSQFTINSNGAIYYDASAAGTVTRHQATWLTYGTNSEYTVNLQMTVGSVNGSQTGADLSLSTTRNWSLQSTATNLILNDEDVAQGVLIVKYNGTEILRRPITLNTGASSDGGFN